MFKRVLFSRTAPLMSLHKCQSRSYSLTKICKLNGPPLMNNPMKTNRFFLSNKHKHPITLNSMEVFTSAVRLVPSSITTTLTVEQAQALALRLTADERQILVNALQEFESKIIKDEYEGQLAAHRWRSKFGRPSKVPKLGDVDPTGTYCPVPEDWLKRKYAATVPEPDTRDLFHLMVANSIPFIGFGFLDNFIMIVAGENIDHMLGAYICLSTMAAAALGNTFSDVIGIGSAYYVERFAERIGFQPPKLTPIQLDMPISRRASNLGRVLGITLGCILGMIPLLFMNADAKGKNKQTQPAAQ